jgi:hypothetical protein
MSDKPEAEGALGSDQFLIMFPCFTVMNRECTSGVLVPQEDRQIACVILTDEDLLRRFRVQHRFGGPTIRFEFEFQLFLYLRSLPPSVTSVAFDPGKTSAVTYPLVRLKRFLWEKVKEEYGED